MAPVAGSRRHWLLAAVTLLAAGCVGSGGPLQSGPALPLQPVRGLLGARLATRLDMSGAPVPGHYGAYVPFVFPVAVAASTTDLYIADAGAGRVFRYDGNLDVMTAIAAANRDTRLQTGADGSLYVLDAGRSEIRRYGRGGQALPALLPRLPTSRYRSFAIDPVTGHGYALDVSFRRVDRIEPLGRIAVAEMELGDAVAVAIDGRSLFLADTRCACVREYREGQFVRHLAAGQLRLPAALATERGRLYAIDAFDRSVVAVHAGGVERMSATELGLIAPEGIAAANGLVYVADGAGHSVAIFQPRRGKP